MPSPPRPRRASENPGDRPGTARGRDSFAHGLAMVQKAQHPSPAIALDDGQRGVVLAQGQDARRWHPEGAAEQDPVRPAVRNHEDGGAFVPLCDGLEGGPRARLHVGQALALGELEAADVGHPGGEGWRVESPDLLRGEPFPASHGELAQLRLRHSLEPVWGDEELGGATRAQKVARVGGAERDAGESPGQSGGLGLAPRRQRHIEMTDEAPRLRSDHAPVAHEVDGGGHQMSWRWMREAAALRVASSPISTDPPRASPVRPPTRETMNTAHSSAEARAMLSRSPPHGPRRKAERAHNAATWTGVAHGERPARNSAPAPFPGVAAGKSGPISTGATRPTAGARRRTAGCRGAGTASTALTAMKRASPMAAAPKTPRWLSRMMARRRSTERPARPSTASARPSR